MDQAVIDTNKANASEQTRIDFKMVTFTLGGKDYSIDIMKVKEISKATKFTFVPNAAPFVTGVYNLRGDIISVIDLRKFFNLPVETDTDNMIILRLEGHVIAVVVDIIDKVVGISSETVQPPHPLFGDINIKYISGVVENEGRLYVILDVERIFNPDDTNEAELPIPASSYTVMAEDVDIGFIEETLVTFASFHASPVNRDWIRERYLSWKKTRKKAEIQLTGLEDAEAFLTPFASPFTATFWSGDYIEKIVSFLNPGSEGNFHVWNPGCGSGHETYSVACMLKNSLPSVHLKIIAHDNDLIKISTAPGLTVDPGRLGSHYDDFLVDGGHGAQFSKEIKDAILFEYHDITHENTLPKLDLVVIRDTVSFLSPESQRSIFSLLEDMVKPGGIMVLGANEIPMKIDTWDKVEKADVVAYKKK